MTQHEHSAIQVVRTAWGNWLGAFEWDHFSTLTFSTPASPHTAMHRLRQWTRRLDQRAGHAIDLFYVLERGPGGLLHLHALTAGTARIGTSALSASWPNGRSDVSEYDPSRGAAHYVTNFVGSDLVEYDIFLT